jgi:hypothetical protein
MAMDECQVKSLLESMHSISGIEVATEVIICLTSVYRTLTNFLGKSLCKMDSTHAHHCPKNRACSCRNSSVVLEKYRQCIPQSHFNG